MKNYSTAADIFSTSNNKNKSSLDFIRPVGNDSIKNK
jgi:hypothetical protein